MVWVRVFLQECLGRSVHDEVAGHKMYQPWKGKMSIFLIVEKLKPGEQGLHQDQEIKTTG